MFMAKSPVMALYGSSLPIWILAALAGVIIALLLRQVLMFTGLARDLPWPAVFHPAVALLSGVVIYVFWIGGFS